MADKVAGFQPSQRRRKGDQASQDSNQKPFNVTGRGPHARTLSKKQNNAQEEKQEILSSPKPKGSGQRNQKSESQEQIASPAIKNLKFAKAAKVPDEMVGSKLRMRESVRPGQVQKVQGSDSMYKLKLLGFMIISFLLILNAMSPSRKVTRRK